MKNFGRHFAVTLFSQILGALQSIVVMPLIIKTAGVTVYGAFVMWNTGLIFFFVLSYFGVGYNYRRKLASAETMTERRGLFIPQFSYQLLALSILTFLAVIALNLTNGRFSDEAMKPSAWVLISWLAVHFVLFQVQEYFRSTVRFDDYNAINIGCLLIYFGLIAAWGFGGMPMTLNWLLILNTIAKVVIVIPWAVKMMKEIGIPRPRLPWATILEDMKVGWPLLLDYICMTALTFGDRYLIAAFMGVTFVGHYQPGYQLAFLLVFFPRCAETILLPILSRYIDSNAHGDAEQLVSKVIDFFFMAAIPFVGGSFMLAPSIIGALSTTETELLTRWVTPLVATGVLFYGITLICYQISYATRKMRLALWGNLIGATFNIGLNVVLLPIFHSLTAAAFACVISYGVSAAYVLWSLHGEWRLNINLLGIFRYVVSTLVMCGALWLAGYPPLALSSASIFAAIGASLMGAAIYFGSLFLLGGLHLRTMTDLVLSRK